MKLVDLILGKKVRASYPEEFRRNIHPVFIVTQVLTDGSGNIFVRGDETGWFHEDYIDLVDGTNLEKSSNKPIPSPERIIRDGYQPNSMKNNDI
jgi:hypothetical protein